MTRAARIIEHRVGGLHVRECLPAGPAHPQTIVFLHGASHGAFCWEGWQDRFAAAGWRSLAPSWRNHPGSDAVPEADFCRLTLLDYVADSRRATEALAGPAPVLIGHSMGGLVGQRLAQDLAAAGSPAAAFVGLAAVSPQGVGPLRRHELPEDRPMLWPPEVARRLLFSHIDDAAFAAFYPRLVPESPSAMNWAGCGRTPVAPDGPGCPMLFVHAGADACGIHPAARLAAFYGADWTEVPGAGHNLMMEPCEAEVARMIMAWLLTRLGSVPVPPLRRAPPAG